MPDAALKTAALHSNLQNFDLPVVRARGDELLVH